MDLLRAEATVHGWKRSGGQRHSPVSWAPPGVLAAVAVCGCPGHTDSHLLIVTEVAILALVVTTVSFAATATVGLVVVLASLLSLNGFTEGHYGQLGWHPGTDLRATTVLAAAWILGIAAHRAATRTAASPGRPDQHGPTQENRVSTAVPST